MLLACLTVRYDASEDPGVLSVQQIYRCPLLPHAPCSLFRHLKFLLELTQMADASCARYYKAWGYKTIVVSGTPFVASMEPRRASASWNHCRDWCLFLWCCTDGRILPEQGRGPPPSQCMCLIRRVCFCPAPPMPFFEGDLSRPAIGLMGTSLQCDNDDDDDDDDDDDHARDHRDECV